jgi:predicted 2-oxoglutarate/Fe(II)-dependent dioxygenase YbiX
MIPKSIKSYVKVYEKFLAKEFCEDVIKNIKKSEWKLHRFYNYKTNSYKSYKNELSVTYLNTEIRKEFNRKLWQAIHQYIIKDFKDFSLWWSQWKGFTEVRFNKYNKTTEMKKHCDHIHTMFDGQRKGIPTLSIVGCLNNNYKGGDFIMWEKEKIKISVGSIMIFPSNFMYPHKVTPIIEGTRYSFVSWVF